jgi:hypothetical protein
MLENKHIVVKRIYADGHVDTEDLGLMTMFEAQITVSADTQEDIRTKRAFSQDIEQSDDTLTVSLYMAPQSVEELLSALDYLLGPKDAPTAPQTPPMTVIPAGGQKSSLTGSAYKAKCDSCPAKSLCFPTL